MKLQAGNPNLKKIASRVNKYAPLAAFASSSPDKNPQQYVRGGARLLHKDPSATPPNTTSVWEQPIYKPEPAAYQRPGSDHSHIKRRGF